MRSPKGTLVIIGGHESRKGEMKILSEIARLLHGRKICVATIASSNSAREQWEEYVSAFSDLGIKKISHLDVSRRGETSNTQGLKALEGVRAVFFTGGDQLKITSEIGGTLIEDRIRSIYESGGIIAGTSAGASVMSETMLVSGPGESYRIGGGLRMAPGLGFIKGVLIDQHFTERGRIGRLLGALAHNPKYTGIGLDENTAIVVENGNRNFRVFGEGGVYVVDARGATDSNISDGDRETSLSLFNVRIHLLSAGDRYDFETRKPELRGADGRPTRKPPQPQKPRKEGRSLRLHEKGRSRATKSPKTSPRA